VKSEPGPNTKSQVRTRSEPDIFCLSPIWARKTDLPSESRHAYLRFIKNHNVYFTRIAADTWFCYTQNSNHLNQKIDLNGHKLSLLVNHNTAECKVSQQKRNYHEAIHNGAIGIKQII